VQSGAVYITGFGASTAIGRDAPATAAAVRAGIAGFCEHPYALDSVDEPVRAAIAPWLDIRVRGLDRLVALLFPAIDQVLEPFRALRPSDLQLGLALALPAPRPGLAPAIDSEVIGAVTGRYRRAFTRTLAFPNGHAAGLMALAAAVDEVAGGSVDGCIVAGVDSYIEPETLHWLEECDQLHSAGFFNNAWGFIPGEAAGALLLLSRTALERCQCDAVAAVEAVGIAHEANRIRTATVCIGEGLGKAFRSALHAVVPERRVTDIYCDLNGEPYRADEYAFASLRVKDWIESATDFVAPADCWGDVAAASGPLHLMLAAQAGEKGYAKGTRALVWASSEGGERAAALVQVKGS
jgi:3-oxoacyl-[acyl-carrier-protein] synthase I